MTILFLLADPETVVDPISGNEISYTHVDEDGGRWMVSGQMNFRALGPIVQSTSYTRKDGLTETAKVVIEEAPDPLA